MSAPSRAEAASSDLGPLHQKDARGTAGASTMSSPGPRPHRAAPSERACCAARLRAAPGAGPFPELGQRPVSGRLPFGALAPCFSDSGGRPPADLASSLHQAFIWRFSGSAGIFSAIPTVWRNPCDRPSGEHYEHLLRPQWPIRRTAMLCMFWIWRKGTRIISISGALGTRGRGGGGSRIYRSRGHSRAISPWQAGRP